MEKIVIDVSAFHIKAILVSNPSIVFEIFCFHMQVWVQIGENKKVQETIIPILVF